MGCAIVSTVFGGAIIICFSISIAMYRYDTYYWYYGYHRHLYSYDTEMAITAITLVLGIVEFGIGIWAAVLCCYMNSCVCCATQSDQVMCVLFFVEHC